MRTASHSVVACFVLSACASAGSDAPAAPAFAATVPPVAASFSSRAAIWVHPDPETEPDVGRMLGGDAAWPQVAAKTAAFGLYAGFIPQLGQRALDIAIAHLKAEHIRIELESPSLQATAACGNGIEGFVPSNQSLVDFTTTYLTMLKTAGANVAYMKVDEPFYFGSVSAQTGSCRWSTAHVARDVGRFVRLVHAIFPELAVGDVEPVIAGAYKPDVITALERWHATYASVNGFGFPFYIADTDFTNPQWPALDEALEHATHAAGMRFGIIYEGLGATSNASWAADVVSQFERYQGTGAGNPDVVLFQTWEPFPSHALPETNSRSLTGVVETYLRAAAP